MNWISWCEGRGITGMLNRFKYEISDRKTTLLYHKSLARQHTKNIVIKISEDLISLLEEMEAQAEIFVVKLAEIETRGGELEEEELNEIIDRNKREDV